MCASTPASLAAAQAPTPHASGFVGSSVLGHACARVTAFQACSSAGTPPAASVLQLPSLRWHKCTRVRSAPPHAQAWVAP